MKTFYCLLILAIFISNAYCAQQNHYLSGLNMQNNAYDMSWLEDTIIEEILEEDNSIRQLETKPLVYTDENQRNINRNTISQVNDWAGFSGILSNVNVNLSEIDTIIRNTHVGFVYLKDIVTYPTLQNTTEIEMFGSSGIKGTKKVGGLSSMGSNSFISWSLVSKESIQKLENNQLHEASRIMCFAWGPENSTGIFYYDGE